MKRRKFIQSIAAVPVLISLPKLVKSQTVTALNFYGVYKNEKLGADKTVHLHIYGVESVASFKSNSSQKEIGFCVGTGDSVKTTKFRVYKNDVRTLKFSDGEEVLYENFLAENSEDLADSYGIFQKRNGKNVLDFGFEGFDFNHGNSEPTAYVFNKNGNILITLEPERKSSSETDNMDCFLTSACVFHKGLDDKCYELETLRALRETHMKPIPQYNSMLAEYKVIAPAMLENIYRAENKSDILECIYEQLVLPSIHLIEQNKLDEAVAYYAEFVQVMQEEYLN
ncbi:hypothetical protein [Sphingobacterium hungaricum]